MRIIQVCPYDLNRPGGVRSHILGLSQSLVDAGHEVVILGPDSSVISNPNDTVSLRTGLESDRGALKNTEEFNKNDDIRSISSAEPIIIDHSTLKSDYDPFEVGENAFTGTLNYLKIGYRRSAIPLWGTQIDFSIASPEEKTTIWNFLKDWSPDVVHFHTPWTPFLSWQMYRLLKKYQDGKKRPVKLIATFHDSPPNTLLGSVFGKFVMPMAARFMLPKFDEVISVSEFQSQFISKWSSKTVHIIPNGIRLDEGESVSWNPSKTILFLGRLEVRKGLMELLQAYKKLRANMSDVKLIVAGAGPQREEGELFSKTHQLDVEFRGMVSEDEKNRLLGDAGVFVSPALYGESFGIVLIEAMANGVPVAGYGNPGYLSVVKGVCEENFPSPGDVHALAEVIEIILGDSDYAKELSRKGRIHARQYDWNVLSKRILKLYS